MNPEPPKVMDGTLSQDKFRLLDQHHHILSLPTPEQG